MRAFAFVFILILLISPGLHAENFKDVPKDHWAAESVEKLANENIVNGYPDKTFKGDRPVTRYELAVALERFIEFVQESKKPLAENTKAPDQWAEQSIAFLKGGGFLATNSKLLTDGNKIVTVEELAQALASVGAKLIEQRVPSSMEKEQ